MNYEEYFKIQALKDFNLNINDYIEEFNLDYILQEKGDIYNHCISQWIYKNNYKKIVEYLVEYKNKLLTMCDYPEALTIEDRQKIKDIKDYLKNNSGKLNGYYSIRKKKTDEIIKEFMDLSLNNRMSLIANKELIVDAIDLLIDKYISMHIKKYKTKHHILYSKKGKDNIVLNIEELNKGC